MAICVATTWKFTLAMFGATMHLPICLAEESGKPAPAASSTTSIVDKEHLFARDNLIAWCIVPFDGKKRGPEQRAEMLERLGFRKFAYDYRAEHVPTFAAELEALARHKIELSAWWFPSALNDEARGILDLLRRNNLHPQLWVSGGGKPTANEKEQHQRVLAEASRIRPIAEEAAKIGCNVGLYNHGGWYGDPDNQLAILAELKLSNIGIVYNFHHGHGDLERFPQLLQRMLPHLYAINLNGMRDVKGQAESILPLGQGDLDLKLLAAIRDGGYRGPIGILGHTQDDAEDRLRDNLDGLDWLVPQLDGKPAGPRPKPRTPFPAAAKLLDVKPPEATPSETKTNADKSTGVKATTPGSATPFGSQYDPQLVTEQIAAANADGDALRGAEVFGSLKFGCLSCHQVGEHGGAVGPPLVDVVKKAKPEEIVESIIWPKRQVKPEFFAWRLSLADGGSLQVYIRGETARELTLFEPATQKTLTLAKSEVEERHELGTLMPDGLAAAMSAKQRRDLFRFLFELGRTPNLASVVRPEVLIGTFNYQRDPLIPADWPQWQQAVNRDRIYDFYLKEALSFREQSHRPHIVPQYPGLDGGKQGHWGNQNEQGWKDDRWNQSDLGSLLCGILHGPGLTVIKAICVRLGEEGELSACFNPETLTYDALWQGGFIKFSDVRHGFMNGLILDGKLLPRPAGKRPDEPFTYHGFYRTGKRVVFSYRLGKVEMLDAPWVADGQFQRVVAPAAEHPLRDVLKGGTPQWPKEFPAKTDLGTGRPYAIDTIEPPFDNPWKSLMFFGDHDFLPDGSALICTMQGDVWHVTGLDDDLQKVRWRRFAAGLHHALGLTVLDGKIYVLGRDQITRLHDLNGDGEADFYECFSNKMETSSGGHDFTTGLICDREGRFYTASGKQGLIRISSDGNQVETLATGFRNPDGLGICPDGALTVPCSEGDWTPASMVCLVWPNSSTQRPPHFGFHGPQNGEPPSLPLVYLPRALDNSSGGQVAIPAGDRWGPLGGQMIHFSYGAGTHYLLLRDEVANQPQGAVVPLTGDFRAGAHRGRFNPRDGQLYVSGMGGWGTYTTDDGSFQRVRYTGDRVQLPRAFHIHENGVLVSFTSPIDAQKIAEPRKQFAQVWNYRYSPGYGSPEFSPSHPGMAGHDLLEVAAVHSIDDHTLFVELPELQPVNQLHLVLQIDDGRPQELFVTVHRLDKPFEGFATYKPAPKVIAAHPQLSDLAMLGKRIENPWSKRKKETAALEIAAAKNLSFATNTLRAPAGALVKLMFHNPDVVPHNWVLIKPGRLAAVGDAANKFIADPEAVLRQYVPPTDDVLAYTDIVPPDESFTIYFDAPKVKGRYPFLCTFPGHWMAMNGELIVE